MARAPTPAGAPAPALEALRRAERALKAVGPRAEEAPPRALRQAADALDAVLAIDLAGLAQQLRAQAPAAAASRRAALASGLRAACDAAGHSARVVTTSPLELRVAPLAVVFDEDLEEAELRFAALPLGRCPAEPAALLAAHAEATAALERGGLAPDRLFDALHAIWTQRGGGWQDLCAALPALCLARQGPAFARDPVGAHFLPYPRAQLAWDLWRMRRERALSRGGLRLSLAPATGGATRDKDTVLLLEDDEGRGQWHRSYSFVPEAP